MNIISKTNCTHRIVTCHKCCSTVAQRGSLFCADCNRALFPQDYEECDAIDESPVYRRVDVDLYVEIIDGEERGALRSDDARDSR